MSQDVLLDLSFLTENERDLIYSVLNKDAVLRQSEQQRIGSLRKDLDDLKENGLPEEEIQTRNENYCARCQTYFGIIFNRGAYCPRCQLKICNSCRVPNAEDGWICTLCHRVREVKAQSGAWFFQGHKQKKSGLFGSTLVRQSLRRYPNNETQPYKGNSYIKDDDSRHKFGDKTIIDSDESEDESEFDSEEESVDQSAVSDETNSKDANEDKKNKETADDMAAQVDLEFSEDRENRELADYMPVQVNYEPNEDMQYKEPADHIATVVYHEPSKVWMKKQPNDDMSTQVGYESSESGESKEALMDHELSEDRENRELADYMPVQVDYEPNEDRENRELADYMPVQVYYEPNEDVQYKEPADNIATVVYHEPSKDWKKKELTDDMATLLGYESSETVVHLGQLKTDDKLMENSRVHLEKSIPVSVRENTSEETMLNDHENIEDFTTNNAHFMISRNVHSEPEDSSELEMNTPDRLQYVGKEGLAVDVDQRSLDLGNQKYSEFDKKADEVIVNDPNESKNAEKDEDSSEMRIMALEKFSESFAVVNHNTGKENTQFDGSDDERSADRLQYKGVAHNDMDSKTLNDSGYVGSNVNFNVKQTPSISGVESSPSPHEDRTIKFSEKAPIIITSKPPEEKLDHASIDDYEEDMDVSFKRYGIGLGNRPLKDQLSLGSRESIMSYYSNAGGEVYGKYPVSGEILFGMKYDHQGQEFQIQVHQARDIAAVDKKHNTSDPYVKTYLLPDRSRDGKRKSKIIKKTINPIFDEILTYRIRYDELLQRTLWLAVWNNDRFGHNDFLGEVVLSIDEYQSSGFNLEDPDPMWRGLCERQSEDVLFSFNGEIVVALKYVPPSAVVDNSKKKKKKKKKEEKGELHVKIIEARDLIAKDSNGFSDPFCKSYLLPDKSKKTKQKTSVVKKSLNPKWNYHFIYDNLTHEELMDRVLELTVWDFDRGSSNEFLGGVRLGLGAGIQEWDDASSEEQAAWNKMLNNHNEWNEISLTLRDHMGKNNSNVISFDPELDENIVESKQNGHSADSRELESHDDHLVRHDEYYSPRESKIDAAMRLNQEKHTKSLTGQTQPSKENKMTLAELAAQTSKNRGTSSPSRSPVLSARKIQCPKYLRPLSASFSSVSTPDISLHEEISSGNGSTGEQQHIDVTDASQTSIRRFSDASVLSSRDSRLRVGSNASDFLRRRSLETNSLRSGSTLSVDESWKGSQTSVYSMDDVSGSHAVSGDIMLSYMYYKGNFKVKIFEARGLLAMDESKNTSNPYVKVFLLPDKSRQGKRKTKTKHETLHPEFNEELLFEIETIELLRRTLWVTVWHYDRFGRNGFLGEVRLPLSDFPGSEVKSHWYPLLQAGPKEDCESTLTGQLVVALMFTKEEKKRKKSNENGKLHVKVVEARNLPGKKADGFSDPFCKCCLLPDPSKTSKRKTSVKKRNLNPIWNHKFSYDNLTIEDLKHKVLELTVWDNHLLSNVFLGCVRIGMGTGIESWDDCRDEEVKLWEFVLSKPNTWAESTLPLRSNIV